MNLFEATQIVENFLETPWEKQPENLYDAAKIWEKGTTEYIKTVEPDQTFRIKNLTNMYLKYQLKLLGLMHAEEMGTGYDFIDQIDFNAPNFMLTLGTISVGTHKHLETLSKLKESNRG